MRRPLILAAVALATAAAAPSTATAADTPKCANVVNSEDFVITYCVDVKGDCLLSRTQRIYMDSWESCVIANPTTASRSSADATDPRCVGNGILGFKYCVDTESSCLLMSYASPPAGSRCLIRRP